VRCLKGHHVRARRRKVRVVEHDGTDAVLERGGAVGDAGIYCTCARTLRVHRRGQIVAHHENGVAYRRGFARVVDANCEKLRASVRVRGRRAVGALRAEVSLYFLLRRRGARKVRLEARLCREEHSSVEAVGRRDARFETGQKRRAEARRPCRAIRGLRLGAPAHVRAARRISRLQESLRPPTCSMLRCKPRRERTPRARPDAGKPGAKRWSPWLNRSPNRRSRPTRWACR
jgi:hypothetical protein